MGQRAKPTSIRSKEQTLPRLCWNGTCCGPEKQISLPRYTAGNRSLGTPALGGLGGEELMASLLLHLHPIQ